MKVLTIRLDPVSGTDVLDALGKLVQQKRPEFLAVQNVTNDQVKKILASTWGTGYKVTHPAYKYETRRNPTVAIFSTYPEEDSATVEYHETGTDKMLQKSYYVMYDKTRKPYVVSVGSTTLESGLKASDLREKQLNEACLSMIDDGDAFLVGDFSLDNDIDGELTLKGGWKDAWLSIPGNTESNGFTYDPDKNPRIKEDPFGPGRPDRIFFKSRHYSLDRVELVGVEPYQLPRGPAVTISSHYGLLAHLTQLDDPIPRVEQQCSRGLNGPCSSKKASSPSWLNRARAEQTHQSILDGTCMSKKSSFIHCMRYFCKSLSSPHIIVCYVYQYHDESEWSCTCN